MRLPLRPFASKIAIVLQTKTGLGAVSNTSLAVVGQNYQTSRLTRSLTSVMDVSRRQPKTTNAVRAATTAIEEESDDEIGSTLLRSNRE